MSSTLSIYIDLLFILLNSIAYTMYSCNIFIDDD